jgi:DNA-binding NarL/FixJ family response regulator
MDTKITIAFADDHEIFRDGLLMLLNSFDNIQVLAAVKNGKDLIRFVEQYQPNVVLTDINMPEMDGIQATKFIRSHFPETKVVALTMYDEEQQIIEMMESGAIGYLVKDASKEEMFDAILAAHNNVNYYCKHTTSKIAKLLTQKATQNAQNIKREMFKEVELEIIKHICNGLTSKEIGALIHLSYRTVEGYRVKIQEKMDVSNTAGIIRFAITNKIVTV